PPAPSLFPYTTLFRSPAGIRPSPECQHQPLGQLQMLSTLHAFDHTLQYLRPGQAIALGDEQPSCHMPGPGYVLGAGEGGDIAMADRKSTRLNSSHVKI